MTVGVILGVVLAALAYIFGLKQKVGSLESKLRTAEMDKEQAETLAQLEETGRSADEKEKKFNDSLAKYLAAREEYRKRTNRLPD